MDYNISDDIPIDESNFAGRYVQKTKQSLDFVQLKGEVALYIKYKAVADLEVICLIGQYTRIIEDQFCQSNEIVNDQCLRPQLSQWLS